jgi:hypothetical protein
MSTDSAPRATHWRRFRALYAVIAVCTAPVIAAYVAYYVVPPSARTNYGQLVDPQRPVPALATMALDGQPFDLGRLRGRWVLISVDRGQCDSGCNDKLLAMRQQRLITGKERERVERVWLITDQEPLPTMLMREYEGTFFVRAPASSLSTWLAGPSASSIRLEDAIYLVDPLGNLMMRWPLPIDQAGLKRDLERLLRASSGWVRIERQP